MRTAGLGALTKRNVKLYFKDKGMFFSSLITPLILLVLYTTFLKNVFEDSFRGALDAAGAAVSDSIIGGCVGGQLVSSLLAVMLCDGCVLFESPYGQDKISGARRDLTVTPVHSGTLALSYYAASLLSTLIISFAASAVCFAYLAAEGWYLSTADIAAVIGDVILLCLFGTALSSCVNFPLTTQGQASAVGTIVSAGYGFICGAYMPISQFSDGLQKVLSFLPGTYGTSMLRNHALRGVFEEMSNHGFPDQVIESIRTV